MDSTRGVHLILEQESSKARPGYSAINIISEVDQNGIMLLDLISYEGAFVISAARSCSPKSRIVSPPALVRFKVIYEDPFQTFPVPGKYGGN